MPDIQEAKCYEFTVRILPPLGAPRGGQKKFFRFAQILPPPYIYFCIRPWGGLRVQGIGQGKERVLWKKKGCFRKENDEERLKKNGKVWKYILVKGVNSSQIN